MNRKLPRASVAALVAVTTIFADVDEPVSGKRVVTPRGGVDTGAGPA